MEKKSITSKHLQKPLLAAFAFVLSVFLHPLFAQTMTFDTGPTHTGFTLAGWSWDPPSQRLFPSAPNVNDFTQITKDAGTWNVTSFQTWPFGGGGGTWRISDNLGHSMNFNPNALPAGHITTLNWFCISWLKIQLIDVGTGGVNQSFDFDNVVYTTAPPPVTMNCAVNTTTGACQTQAALNSAFTTWLNSATATGGCFGVMTNNNTGAPPICGGSTTVTFTYTHSTGTNTCQATFTVPTPSAPVLNCPTNLIRPGCSTRSQDSIAMQNWVNTSTFSGGCNGVISYNGFNGSPPDRCGGSKTLTLTYTTSCAAPLTCSATFTIPTPPAVALNCAVNKTEPAGQTQQAINTSFANWLATTTGSGGCNGVLSNNNSGAPPATGGTTTVTFTYTSSCAPLTTTCQATFTVSSDMTPPVFTFCPPGSDLGCNPTGVPGPGAATATDECGPPTITSALGGISSNGCQRSQTRTYTATDCVGNSSTCTQTFTWTFDVTPPTFTFCPPGSDLGCNPTEVPGPGNATATDACGTPTITSALGSITSNGCQRSQTRTYTATDGCGNSATCTQTFTWTFDVSPPTFTFCPLGSDLGCNPTGVPGPGNATATDACGTPTITSALGSITSNGCQRSQTRTYTATDGCGNSATCAQVFTWTVDPPVTLTCPTNTSTAACQTQAQVTDAFNAWLATATFTGGCNGVLTNNNQGPPPICGGSTTVTFTVNSACQAPSSCAATFTVIAAPTVVLSCPANMTIASCQTQAAVDQQFAAWLAMASASGGCNGVLTNNSQGAPSNCGGSTTVIFTYASSCAPTVTTCTATFTVTASAPVVLTCPANTTASACLTQAQLNTAYSAWLASATASGGCNGVLTNNSPSTPLVCSPVAVVRTVTFTYTSSCAPLTTSCTTTFTVPAYPTFTVPANGAATVPCPANATQPTPPVVVDGCGKTLTPTGPVIVNNPNPLTCQGTRSYTWTYTDCAGNVRIWSFTYTVVRLPFGVPANGGATVNCPSNTDVTPTPPAVFSNCGEPLTPVLTSVSPKPGCEGSRNYTWTYTDCTGNSRQWTFIYMVKIPDFTVPADQTQTVECPFNVVVPTAPVVYDACNNLLNPSGPVITSSSSGMGCESSRKYTWTYNDCTGRTHTWSKTFNFAYTADFFVYPDGEDFVGCMLYVVPPMPPPIYDNCSQLLKVTGPTITETLDPSGCSGVRKYTFIYTDCGGHSHPWTYTYYANDNEPPLGNCVSTSINNVNVTNLACIEDVPCPDSYNFSAKIAQMIAAGSIYDLCSGTNLNVELDSWSALWQCSDPDGDGIFNFGRTFYFRISDQCGNEMPNLCGVTYSGVCQPLETFLQEEWGNEGGEPGNSTPGGFTDLQTITTLLGQGPLVIGGPNRSLTLTNAQCLMNLVPGIGFPAILGNCIQTNCMGCNPAGTLGMKNSLATNTIAMILNNRFNVQYHGLTMNNIRNQSLSCLDIDPFIKSCSESGNPPTVSCKLVLFESDGTAHQFPYTIGGLIDMANLYLDGNLMLTDGASSGYASAINNSITKVNAYWHNGNTPTTCDPSAGSAVVADNGSDKAQPSLPTGKLDKRTSFSLAPNPANDEVTFQLAELPEAQVVSFEIYNYMGQRLLRKEFGKVAYVNERVDLSGISAGLYIVSVKAGVQRFERKLVVNKD